MPAPLLKKLHQKRWQITLFSFLFFTLVITAFEPLQILNYGLTTPQPIGTYLNGTFPTEAPSSSSSWTSVVAYPNLTFTDPLQLLEVPYTNLFLMAGKKGKLWSFAKDDTTTSVKTTILDIESQVITSGDAGLLGATLHPEYGQPGSPNREYLYLWYRARGPYTSGNKAYLRLSRFNWVPGSSTVTPGSEYVMIQQYDRHQWHNGGGIFFGLDGFLYISVGDEGGANDQYNNGQKINEGLLAGALRIDVDMDPTRSHPIRRQPLNPAPPPTGWPDSYSQGYWIPNDNPWQSLDSSNLEEFFAIGFRSPHRMTQDPVTGDIWMGDVGQGSREEISQVFSGANLQWPYMEGDISGPKAQPNPLLGIDNPPVYAYPRSVGSCVIGGLVYRGNKWNASLGGKYLFGDHANRKIWAMDYDPGTGSTNIDLLTTIPAFGTGSKAGISNFSTDSLGEIYILKLFGTNLDGGKIYKLRPQNYSPEPPQFLSQTGAFTDLTNLTPAPGLIPYSVNTPLWTDGATKKRWIAIPNNGSYNTAAEQVVFAENSEWTFPEGTVFIKHFAMPLDENNPSLLKRLETRFVVRKQNGGLYGVTYKWNAAGTDAELLSDTDTLSYTITKADLSQENRIWTFPSRADCMTCHNTNAKGVLGIKTHQLNGDLYYPGNGVTDNQLRSWNHLGIFSSPIVEADIPSMPRAVGLDDTTSGLASRVRSYLDANCAHCHRPNGVAADFDARYTTPLPDQGLVNGSLQGSYGLSYAAVIKPHDQPLSVLLQRDNSLGADAMPPLGKSVIDELYITVLRDWIDSMNPDCDPAEVHQAQYTLESVDSEQAASHLAVNAFDGNPNTFWHTQYVGGNPGHPHEIVLDLEDTLEVAGFRYLPRQDGSLNGTIANYAFYVSLDGTNWQAPISSGTLAANASEKEVVAGTSKLGRYVRLVALSEVNNNPWTSAAELNILDLSYALGNPDCSPSFPVEWLFFQAQPQDSVVALTWATAMEVDNRYFGLERSVDGLVFDEIQKVNAVGNSQQMTTYHTDDPQPMPGFSYYRLRQVDLDGRFTHSEVVEVFFHPTALRLGLQAFPNHLRSGEKLRIEYVASEAQNLQLEIYDLNGHLLRQKNLVSHQGKNGTWVDSQGMAAGIYHLRLYNQQWSESIKIVVH
jgi:uncharacterized repeat protein (TIGR03806 family)